MIQFSLIVATIGRKRELAALLSSLARQNARDFEVILVDQNPGGFLDDLISPYSTVLPITHLRTVRRGASHARNLGIDKAVGKIVTFPDDDCEYPQDLLAMVGDLFEEAPGLSGITVASRDRHSDGRISRFARRGAPLTRFNILNRCIEFGIFVRRDALDKHRFDESMGVGAEGSSWWSDEGPDLVLSMMKRGHRFKFVPEVVIFHPDPVWKYDEKAIIRSFRYGCGRGHYLRKHGYPMWFVGYVWSLYVAGICFGVAQLKPGKAKYYWRGLRGRVTGYFDRRPIVDE